MIKQFNTQNNTYPIYTDEINNKEGNLHGG